MRFNQWEETFINQQSHCLLIMAFFLIISLAFKESFLIFMMKDKLFPCLLVDSLCKHFPI